jgi:hypothetical protein
MEREYMITIRGESFKISWNEMLEVYIQIIQHMGSKSGKQHITLKE